MNLEPGAVDLVSIDDPSPPGTSSAWVRSQLTSGRIASNDGATVGMVTIGDMVSRALRIPLSPSNLSSRSSGRISRRIVGPVDPRTCNPDGVDEPSTTSPVSFMIRPGDGQAPLMNVLVAGVLVLLSLLEWFRTHSEGRRMGKQQ